ncbi:hypothetical protein [Glutamicibacter sp.]|uniref:hypothetical protein n=1 Tax=Glutamicibacter sp. TaxID=1931995 RepID=UPI0028BEC42D|nr:hypothetical protein [Glutamicibacter sp.]
MSTKPIDDHPMLRAHRVLRPGFGTEAAVYGTILVSGLIALSAVHGESSVIALVTVVVTVLVFWAAHVYAGTVAELGAQGEAHISVGTALRRSLKHSFGMLTSAAIPVLILLLGTTRLIPDDVANEIALWSGTVILAFLGYVAFLRRGSPIWARALGALTTASFGIVFIILKAWVH